MTNNTLPNVPRELLADLLGNDHDKRIMAERHLLAMLANAPSPAGVDGWDVAGDILVKLSAAQLEIDQQAQRIGELEGLLRDFAYHTQRREMPTESSLAEWADRLNAAPVQQVSVPDEMRSLAQRLREYNQNPHHINPMSEAFHILVADAANAISTACVPKEIAAAITWSEHLLFECGALTSTRAPSVHVYNKTFAAVNEARAMLNAAPVSEAKAQGVVMPEPSGWVGGGLFFHDRDKALEAAAKSPCVEVYSRSQMLARRNAAPVQQVSVPDGPAKMQWPEIVALVNEVLGCEAHKYPCERGSIGHEMTGINFNSLARIIDRVRYAAAPAAPAADAGLVLEQAMYALIGIGYHENSGLVHELRQALAAHSAKGVV